jgi:hypothetical protein
MGRRIYSAAFDTTNIGTAVQDIFSLLAPASKGIQVHWAHVGAAGVTTAAEVRMRIKRGTATVTQGSGGTAPTPGIVDGGDTLAAAVVAHCNDTTQATTTGNFTGFVEYDQWNVLLPWDYMPGPEDEDRPTTLVSQAFIIDLPATIAAVVSASGFIRWREVP